MRTARAGSAPRAPAFSAAPALALVASLPDTTALLCLVGVAAGPFVGVLTIPGLTLLAQGSDDGGLDHTYAYAVMTLVWAGSQAVASGAGGALARATSDFVPYAIVAAIILATLSTTRSRTGRPSAHAA
jgi:hypothetical protein